MGLGVVANAGELSSLLVTLVQFPVCPDTRLLEKKCSSLRFISTLRSEVSYLEADQYELQRAEQVEEAAL